LKTLKKKTTETKAKNNHLEREVAEMKHKLNSLQKKRKLEETKEQDRYMERLQKRRQAGQLLNMNIMWQQSEKKLECKY
jgi:hypothetical protein